MSDSICKKIYSGFDLGKILCALFILFYHFFSEIRPLQNIFGEILSLYAVIVALFMAISGFLMFDKLMREPDKKQRWILVRKQVLHILTVYAIWSILYIAYDISTWDPAEINLIFVLQNIRRWVFQSTFYTIWFMPSLAFGTLFGFFVSEKVRHAAFGYVLAVIMYAFGSLSSTYIFLGSQIPGWNHFVDFCGQWLGGNRGWLFYAFPLLFVGRLASSKKDSVSFVHAISGTVISGILLLCEALMLRKIAGHTGIDLVFMILPTMFYMVLVLAKLKIKIGKTVSKFLRNLSTVIFMSQRVFLTVLPGIFSYQMTKIVNGGSLLTCLWICGGTILFSILIVSASGKLKFLKLLY